MDSGGGRSTFEAKSDAHAAILLYQMFGWPIKTQCRMRGLFGVFKDELTGHEVYTMLQENRENG